jgi:5-methyltetrahydropteroyltriglutamate--homocysteine methyltransferase
MKRSSDRILTTHAGSLARPPELLDLMQAKETGQPYDHEAFASEVRRAVEDRVKHQAESGVDVVTDGEQSKAGFSVYIRERLGGFETRPVQAGGGLGSRRDRESMAFPEYYEKYYWGPRLKSRVGRQQGMVCTAPVTYVGQDAVKKDIENLKAALSGLDVTEVFMPSTAPRGVGRNEYYKTEEEYLTACADAVSQEYRAIVDAGFLLQVDDPALTNFYSQDDATEEEKRKKVERYIELLAYALKGIPEEKVRFHTCYGVNEGPRIFDTPLQDYAELMFKIPAQAYSFEAANPRHNHEWKVFEDVKLPEGKVIIPGVISHTTNIVEHPEFIAERLAQYGRLVGRENVIAGADCGFSSQATFEPEVEPKVVWAKFEAMAEGARLASKELWRK